MDIFGIESWIGWKRKTSMKKHPDDDANDRGYREHKSVPYYDQVKVISRQERYMKTFRKFPFVFVMVGRLLKVFRCSGRISTYLK